MLFSFVSCCAFRLRKALLPALALALAGLSAGCAPSARYCGAALLHSSPEGAEVLDLNDDSASLGLTPLVVFWESQNGEPKYVSVQLKKAGFRDAVSSFWLNTSHESRDAAQEEAQAVTVELEPEEPVR